MLIITVFGLRYYCFTHNIEIYAFSLTRIDDLALGSLLALIERRSFFEPKNAHKLLLILLFLLIPFFILWYVFTGLRNDYIQLIKYNIAAVVFFLFVAYALCLDFGHPLSKVLQNSFFEFTAKISYGLYVYHMLVYDLMKKYLFTNYWYCDLLTSLSVIYICAGLSFFFFEKRLMDLKRFFVYK